VLRHQPQHHVEHLAEHLFIEPLPHSRHRRLFQRPASGDLCGRFSGVQRSFVMPAGYPEMIDSEETFPELSGLECSGVLADGVFRLSLYMGEPRRSFSAVTIRLGTN